jgi:hypothetical protein
VERWERETQLHKTEVIMTNIIPADFFGTAISIIDHDGKRWLTAEQTGRALGYNEANARQGVLKLYKKHEAEFNDNDKGVVDLATPGGVQKTTVFSGSGCILLSFFAGTKRAVDFRAWAKAHLAGQLAVRHDAAPVRQDIAVCQYLAREIGQLRDMVAAQGQTILGLYAQVTTAQQGHIRALSKLLKKETAPDLSPWELEEALARLAAAAELDPAGKAGVARRLAVSRPILARVLSENDPTPLSLKLARKILATLPRVHLGMAARQGELALVEGRA